MPVLSRFELFAIEPPRPADSVGMASAIATQTLDRLGLSGRLTLERKCLYLLAHMTPRHMVRTVEKAAAVAMVDGTAEIRESDLWAIAMSADREERLH